MYGGPLLFDIHDLPKYVEFAGDGARTANILHIAELLNQGSIIAVVRGKAEFGPRALGHRSLLAVPHLENMKTRMNRLKFREWWRPVAPMVTVEDAKRLFVGPSVWSPYMTFAVEIKKEFRSSLPAVMHFDGTARLQTVDKRDNIWLWKLLKAMKKKTGKAMLCNTSFNTRGKPILNKLSEAMKMLFELPDLDYVLIDDILFSKPGASRTRALWSQEQTTATKE
jgi:carbamoyltransferase